MTWRAVGEGTRHEGNRRSMQRVECSDAGSRGIRDGVENENISKGKQQKKQMERTRLGRGQRGPKAGATRHRARGYLEKSVRKEIKKNLQGVGRRRGWGGNGRSGPSEKKSASRTRNVELG